MGSSIAGSYAQIMERLAAVYETPMSFHVGMGVGGIMDVPEQLAKASATEHHKLKGRSGYEGFMRFVFHPEWDQIRMADLEAWKPELVVWADDWGLLADLPSEQVRPIL